MSKKNYSSYQVEEVVKMAQAGDSDAVTYLLIFFKDLVKTNARPLFLVGGDEEDLLQEGSIGLYNAILSYVPDKNASFKTFAANCIRRKMYSAITAAGRDKNKPLNESRSLDEPLSDEDGDYKSTLSDVLPAGDFSDPEKLILDSERMETLNKKLSSLEKKVFELYLDGLSYQEIGDIVGKTAKNVDNAVQRIRAKLKDTFS